MSHRNPDPPFISSSSVRYSGPLRFLDNAAGVCDLLRGADLLATPSQHFDEVVSGFFGEKSHLRQLSPTNGGWQTQNQGYLTTNLMPFRTPPKKKVPSKFMAGLKGLLTIGFP